MSQSEWRLGCYQTVFILLPISARCSRSIQSNFPRLKSFSASRTLLAARCFPKSLLLFLAHPSKVYEGIGFNVIAPGVVNTPMNPPEMHEILKPLSPLKRLATVEEIAERLLHLGRAPFMKWRNRSILMVGAHARKW
jgi:NAD(P)-dependent dehydrogenase (short-subunit alcohol dehydrogenase family)